MLPALDLSVLFSEPKIPQSTCTECPKPAFTAFQCSSASRKFLNRCTNRALRVCSALSVLFSEPKIPQSPAVLRRMRPAYRFQCSSASRKFLNPKSQRLMWSAFPTFSALQRAENSSINPVIPQHCARLCLSVLFSEPKIPQLNISSSPSSHSSAFQCSSASRKFLNKCERCGTPRRRRRFQCSSASRKFLNAH